MSVRVNLLPGDVAKKARASQARVGVGLGFVALIAVLGLLYVNQTRRVSAAQADVDAAQQRVDDLQADLRALGEFAELQRRAEVVDTILVAAMASEVSVAGILQDVAAVMPGDAALTSLNLSLTGAPGGLGLGDERPAFGTMSFTGRSLRGHAPGLERLLLEFDKIAAFGDLYFSNSALDTENGAADFSVEVDLGPEILTGRYLTGLPEELR